MAVCTGGASFEVPDEPFPDLPSAGQRYVQSSQVTALVVLWVFLTAGLAKMNLLGSFLKSSGFFCWPFLLSHLPTALIKTRMAGLP